MLVSAIINAITRVETMVDPAGVHGLWVQHTMKSLLGVDMRQPLSMGHGIMSLISLLREDITQGGGGWAITLHRSNVMVHGLPAMDTSDGQTCKGRRKHHEGYTC
ncbi:MAG: hypothetical protein C4294_20220 [Nitrospiraceae bacterium]